MASQQWVKRMFLMMGEPFCDDWSWFRDMRVRFETFYDVTKWVKAIFRWVEGILWWIASIWLDFGTICDDWEHFVRFGDDLGHVVVNLWPSRTIESDLLKFWMKFCGLEASRSNSEAMYGSVRRFRAICDGLMTFSDDLSEIRSNLGRWRHSMMSLVSEFEVLGWLVEIAASSGTVKLNSRRFEGVVVKRDRIQNSRLPITMNWWQWNN